MTGRQRPAGRGTGTPSIDPAIIRAAIAYLERHTFLAPAARFGVAVRTLTRWRDRHAASGGRWPTDEDLAYWRARQQTRAADRARARSWARRRALAGGPLFVDATGTTRRIHALSAVGWRYRDMAAELGVTTSRLTHLGRVSSPRVHRDTAAAVAAMYDRLSMIPGPSDLTRGTAARRGWAPPLAWDDESIDDPKARPNRGVFAGSRRGPVDEIAVQRAMRGDPVVLRPADRTEAVRRLTAAGRSAGEIAGLLGTTPRSVTRHRSTDTTRRTA